jgi:hypothetical protein
MAAAVQRFVIAAGKFGRIVPVCDIKPLVSKEKSALSRRHHTR